MKGDQERQEGCGWGCEGRSREEVQPTYCSLILQNSVPHIKLYSSPCLSLPQSCVITVDSAIHCKILFCVDMYMCRSACTVRCVDLHGTSDAL